MKRLILTLMIGLFALAPAIDDAFARRNASSGSHHSSGSHRSSHRSSGHSSSHRSSRASHASGQKASGKFIIRKCKTDACQHKHPSGRYAIPLKKKRA